MSEETKRIPFNLTFTVTKTYDVGVLLDVPENCISTGDVKRLIDDVEIDWLEELNEQHSTSSIEQHGEVEHMELLSVEFAEAVSYRPGDLLSAVDTSVANKYFGKACTVCGEVGRGHTCCPPDVEGKSEGAGMKPSEDFEPVTKRQPYPKSATIIHPNDCDCCNGRGFLFPWGEDTGYACVERCDQCQRFESDEEAAAELREKLLKLNEGYTVAQLVLPGYEWEEVGSTRFMVLRKYEFAGAIAYQPLTFRPAGTLLADRLFPLDYPRCCPECGATDLRVELPAVFYWNGKDNAVGNRDLRATEFPLQLDACVQCLQCDWDGLVCDLEDK